MRLEPKFPSDIAVSALVLAAGRGHRLRPFTDLTPKPLLTVLDRPLLAVILRQLADAGVRRVGVNACHLADQMVGFVEASRGSWPDTSVEVRIEAVPTGPAGALRVFEDLICDSDVTIVISGDALIALDVKTLVHRHVQSGAIMSVVTKPMADASRFGVVEADCQGRVVTWLEKPSISKDQVRNVSCGVYAVTGEALPVLSPSEVVDFGLDLALPLLTRKMRITAVPLAGYWTDVGSSSTLLEANLAAASGDTGIAELDHLAAARSISTWEWESQPAHFVRGPVFIGEAAEIGKNSTLVGPAVIGTHSRVGGSAHIERSVLLPGAEVPTGQLAINTIIWRPPSSFSSR